MSEFNQKEYIKSWRKENMRQVKVEFKKDFVEEFKEACKILHTPQAQVIKKAMQETINKAKEV